MSFPDSSFRSNGVLLTSGLFYETAIKTQLKDVSRCIFSLEGKNKVEPVSGRPLLNARALFVALEDPSGLKFAKEYLENFDHFKRLERSTTFQPYFKTWRAEIEAILEERALRVVRELMVDVEVPEGTRLSAAKYIASKGWKEKQKASSGRGRPTKTQVDNELKKAVKERSQEESDAERMGIRLVKG